ncbi:MAG: Uncharacterized protein conserved in bacteria with the myosin-like domain [Phormidesmis priestleyi Ana]|uniref:Uncharacterized protein conserved in bacteria with the myosin-like domain n=1 Tax=Phormidesmis priestleyi Ana TaxID=1666911 RepID=A0A0N8KNN5_9CYAN|nr:MAG: Uncharacterized protein conserved in bacteria with the myosin-like domain [Phormidesmis priestleyi Ana]
MTGFVLLFAVACLGGVIATVGDRIGMKVGKSRLSLFNLRPRQTATLVSVATGMVASFSTLLLLIALDDQLRKGLFQLDDIQNELAAAQQDLESTRSERDAVENILEESTQLQKAAQSRLLEINESLQTAVAREEETLNRLLDTQSQLESVSEQATSLRDEINDLRSEREALIQDQAKVRAQIAQRDDEIVERDQQLSARDREVAERSAALATVNAELAERDREIAERESRLTDLQTQQAFLSEEIKTLESEFQGLRLGNVAIGRNQPLALTITRTDSEAAAQRAVEDALLTANVRAAQTILPGIETVDAQVIRYDPAVAQQIVSAITDRQNYAIVVSSAANYIVGEPCANAALTQNGEPCLQVNINAVVNEVKFQTGDVLASARLAEGVSVNALIERFELLRATAQFQAQRQGIISYQPIIANGFLDPVLEFLNQVQQYNEPVEIQLIASQPVLTTGPVYLDLAAVQNGQILFRTRDSDQARR